MITLGAPLQGKVRGVIAADIKLDEFSRSVEAIASGGPSAAEHFGASPPRGWNRDFSLERHDGTLAQRFSRPGPGRSADFSIVPGLEEAR
jgi:hypothetical protein